MMTKTDNQNNDILNQLCDKAEINKLHQNYNIKLVHN